MAGAANSNDDEPIAAINIVPFVDIILVVLIIFMVTAPLVLKPVIDINLPKSSSGETNATTPLNVSVKPDGSIAINGLVATTEALAAASAELAKSQPESAAILQADRTVTLETLTAVIDIIKSAGVKRVAFSIDKK